MDQGLVFYNKISNGIDYEYAARCKCKLGQISSSRIMTVRDDLAEELALENYLEAENRP